MSEKRTDSHPCTSRKHFIPGGRGLCACSMFTAAPTVAGNALIVTIIDPSVMEVAHEAYIQCTKDWQAPGEADT